MVRPATWVEDRPDNCVVVLSAWISAELSAPISLVFSAPISVEVNASACAVVRLVIVVVLRPPT